MREQGFFQQFISSCGLAMAAAYSHDNRNECQIVHLSKVHCSVNPGIINLDVVPRVDYG